MKNEGDVGPETMASLIFPRKVKLLISALRTDHQLIYFRIQESEMPPLIFFFRHEPLANQWIERLNKPLEILELSTVFAMHVLQKKTNIRLLVLDPDPERDVFLDEQIVSLSPKILKPEQIDYTRLSLLGCTLESE